VNPSQVERVWCTERQPLGCPAGVGRLGKDRDQEPLPLDQLPDGELIRRIRADDIDAFEAFFDRHRALIFRTAYGLTGDRSAAEEILQDTFIRAYRHRTTLRDDISPVPWLHRVALNLCYTRLGRRRLPTEPIDATAAGELQDHALEPPEWAIREELRHSIRQGIAALAPKHQGVIVLYYLHGLSLQETAKALDVALGTVKSRLHYALHALRFQLEGEHREAPARGAELRPAGAIGRPPEPGRR
jgi:RNA polymerase sigma-70 factor (ECF subfamily)